MMLYTLGLLLINSPVKASEVITEKDRFIDLKTEKYVSVCEQKDGVFIVKETCGKHWKAFTRKRDQLLKEVKNYGELEHHSMVMFPVKNTDGDPKMVMGRVTTMYENGRINVTTENII